MPIKSWRTGWIFGCCLFIWISCNRTGNDNPRLEKALSLSGSNRQELEKVLHHFSQNPSDSLYLKAAIFLIENMPGHWSPSPKDFQSYLKRLDTLKNLSPLTRKILLTYPAEHPGLCPDFTPVEDIKQIKADFLIRHIRAVFALKTSCPWLAHIDFETFCEYLLPYRIGREMPEELSTLLLDSTFRQSIEYAKCYYDDCRHSIQALNQYLAKQNFSSFPPQNDKELYNLLMLDPNNTKASLIQYRVAGIPAATDFSAIQRRQDKVTYWLYTQDPRINHINTSSIANLRIGKIYRQTFSSNPLPETKEYVPPFFKDPFNQDVTDLYLHTADISIDIPATVHTEYAYLAVYDDVTWQPVAYSPIQKGKGYFNKLGRNCIYLPVYYPDNRIQAFAPPFILNNNGQITPFRTDKTHLQALHIRRLQPYSAETDYMGYYLKNARIECADDSAFLHADTVFTIQESPYYYQDTIRPDKHYKKRYWRISPQFGISNLAELHFYDSSGEALHGVPIGPDTTFYRNLTDHDPASNKAIRKWFGYDFGHPVSVSEIVYLNFNDGENICVGHEYELCYFDEGQWQTAGVTTATDHVIEFNRVPSSALFQVKDRTRNRNGSLFTYENGKIRFW